MLFVECLSVNREKRENIEVHLNEFGYGSRCGEISPWAQNHGQDSSYFEMKITEGSACMDRHLCPRFFSCMAYC